MQRDMSVSGLVATVCIKGGTAHAHCPLCDQIAQQGRSGQVQVEIAPAQTRVPQRQQQQRHPRRVSEFKLGDDERGVWLGHQAGVQLQVRRYGLLHLRPQVSQLLDQAVHLSGVERSGDADTHTPFVVAEVHVVASVEVDQEGCHAA